MCELCFGVHLLKFKRSEVTFLRFKLMTQAVQVPVTRHLFVFYIYIQSFSCRFYPNKGYDRGTVRLGLFTYAAADLVISSFNTRPLVYLLLHRPVGV